MTELGRGEILIFDEEEVAAVSLSMNERAATLVDAMVADADALGIDVRTLDSRRARRRLRRRRPAAESRPG